MSDLMTILASLQDQGVDTSAEMLLLRQREKAGERQGRYELMDNTRFYGIDIGDGETAAAWVSADAALLPRVVTLGSTKSMLSVVGALNGKPVVGDQALLQPGVADIKARFKSRYLTDPAAGQTVSLFAQGLYEHVKGDMAGASEVHTALGLAIGASLFLCPGLMPATG